MDNNVAEGRSGSNAAMHYRQGIEIKKSTLELVDLNEVVRDCIKVLENEIQSVKAIVRFDLLPCINGNNQKIQSLFTNLLTSIIQHPPPHTKLLIYFSSRQNNTEMMDLSLPEGYQSYTISVYTNILSNEAWQAQNEKKLAACSSISKISGGSFTFYDISTTGCLYTLEVPGKPTK